MGTETQLCLDLPAVSEATGARVWLITASEADASVLAAAPRCGPRRRMPFAFVDLETGASPISPGDIVLLKVAAEDEVAVLADPARVGNRDPREIAGRLASLLEAPPAASLTRRTLDLGLVRFIGHSKRGRRRGWSRNPFERSLDSLLCRWIAGNPKVSGRICRDLLEDPALDPASLIRAIALRMQGDSFAMASAGRRADAIIAYREACRAFRGAGALAQSSASARLASRLDTLGRQLDFWDETACDRSRHDGFGFHLCRFSGMRLPFEFEGWGRAACSSELLRHEQVATLRVSLEHIARWLSGASASTHMASLKPTTPAGPWSGEKRGRRYVEFVIDNELATRAGLAGNAPCSDPDTCEALYRLIPTSSSCRMHPPSAIATLGQAARFEILGDRVRKHRVNLLVLTPDAGASNMRFDI